MEEGKGRTGMTGKMPRTLLTFCHFQLSRGLSVPVFVLCLPDEVNLRTVRRTDVCLMSSPAPQSGILNCHPSKAECQVQVASRKDQNTNLKQWGSGVHSSMRETRREQKKKKKKKSKGDLRSMCIPRILVRRPHLRTRTPLGAPGAGPLQDISNPIQPIHPFTHPAQSNWTSSPIPLHNPAIQRPRQHQAAPSTKQKKHRASKGNEPRAIVHLSLLSKTAHPIQFPLDPRLAVPFFYSTVPGPFFLSWAYFLSHSPSRVVSSLATAAPHVLGAQLDSTSSRASTAVCALSICPRLFSLRPHYCSAYGYDSRPTQTPSWLDTTAFNLVVPIPRDPIRIPARRLYIARTCCTNLPYSVHHLTCFVLRTANPAFIRVPGTVHCIACPPFLLLLQPFTIRLRFPYEIHQISGSFPTDTTPPRLSYVALALFSSTTSTLSHQTTTRTRTGSDSTPPAAPYNDTRHGANRTHCLSRVRLSSWLLADPAIAICKPRLSNGPILAQPRFCINKVNS
ncbi:uncharacterized protein CLUP02_08540 [Colletotrichum lupini]|uniref:Uncharacterized protein n=1 Tax=Colletotrichum lupini TaxID=145971 RepID=A0A9Q8WGZ9_9PEZI|nr:uncharacterized protein CLUP02_08540 [Colletotrichum lupini]UQC83049.1 hypothetical protein CLUP02_08540 [Colletotrichum lupini]